jgi:hypothetical protein
MDMQTLEANVIAESHRTDKASEVPSFIRRAEDRIAREVRAVEMLRFLELTEAERLVAYSPAYRLPLTFLEDRTVSLRQTAQEGFEDFTQRPLEKVTASDLWTVRSNGAVRWYALKGDDTSAIIEFRGNPAEDSIFDIEYFAKPARLVNPTDTNRLLENHEALYLSATLFELFRNVQDLELAQGQLDVYTDAKNTVNELAGRYFGGTRLFGRKRVIGETAGSGY